MRAPRITISCEPQISAEINARGLPEFVRGVFPAARVELRQDWAFADGDRAKALICGAEGARRAGDAGRGGLGAVDDGPDGSFPAMYDGFALCDAASETIGAWPGPTHPDPATLHVVFTGMLSCTFEEGDQRYHARTLVGANPFLVSLQGIVEGPARPRGYYTERLAGLYAAAMIGGRARDAGDAQAKDAKKYDYVTRGDCRMPDVARGYLLQTVAYFETGEAFCQDDSCRMYNAHWQSEVIRTQVSSPRLCARHRGMVDKMKV